MHSLFIGLGGAGSYAVAELKRKMLNYGYDVNQDKFLYIDTDQQIKNEFDFIQDDFVSLSGDGNTQYSVDSVKEDAKKWSAAIHNNSLSTKGKHFFTWFDTVSPSLKSNRDLTSGAEGARMYTRVMLWKNYSTIKNRIQEALSYRDENDMDRSMERIYLVSGTCGGTGSGCVLDIMYMLGEIQNENQEHAVDLKVNTILVMPHGYIKGLENTDVRKDKYQTNAFAMLEEINACTKDYYLVEGGDEGKSFFRYRCMADVAQKPFGFSVCNTLYMIDSYDNKYKKDVIDYYQVSERVSNFLFALESGSAAKQITDGNFCNITKSQAETTVSIPYLKGFCGNGMFIVQTWEEMIRKYVREKFIYQMFQYGFVGSDAFNLKSREEGTGLDPTLSKALKDFSTRLEAIKKSFDDNVRSDLKDIFKDKNSILKGIASKIKESPLQTKANAVETFFPEGDSRKRVKENLEHSLGEVKEAAYTICMDMVKRYSLRHTIKLIDELDVQYTKVYKGKAQDVESYCKKVDEYINRNRLNDCKKAFESYIEYLFYRVLSNENDGYLDVCRRCLTDAVDNLQEEGRKLPGSDVKIKEWEKKFNLYLSGLRADQTRMLIPELPTDLLSRKNNELDRSYARLVLQKSNADGPDLTGTDNGQQIGGKPLYYFKDQIMAELFNENKTWDNDWFTFENNTFADRCSSILDAFMKKVIQKADSASISQSSSLSIPFMEKYNELDSTAKKNVKDALVAYADVALSLTKAAEGNGTVSGQIVYLSAGLDEREGLGNELKGASTRKITGGQMAVSISDSIISDRLIKLYVRSGYGFDDYSFFDNYHRAFDTYYANPSANHHQCFIHKDFLEARKKGISLNKFFDSDARKAYQESLRDMWRNQEGVVFKFAVLFMARLLRQTSSYNLMSHFRPLGNFVKEERSGRIWKITLGTTGDVQNNPSKQRYTVAASSTFNMLASLDRAKIEPYKDYIVFWYSILQRLTQSNEGFLSDTSVNSIFEESFRDLMDKLSISEQTVLANMTGNYGQYKKNDRGDKILDETGAPILEQWNWKKFYNDCLLGLFDK